MSRKHSLVALCLAAGVALIAPLNASKTFMETEINEQPRAVAETTRIFHNYDGYHAFPKLPIAPKDIKRIGIVACGTSYHAGLISQSWFEKYAQLPVNVSIASEFTKRRLLEDATSTLVIYLSQSGTTTHTLDAMKYANKYKSISIVNNEGSPIALDADLSICTRAGKETSVAATKSFTTQLVVLAHLALALGLERSDKIHKVNKALRYMNVLMPVEIDDFFKSPLFKDMELALKKNQECQRIGQMLATKTNVFCLGSGTGYGMAREAALKLKETSYFKAEALPLGELKHGPLAMLDEKSAVLIVATHETSTKELQAAYEEIRKRKSVVILLDSSQRLVNTDKQSEIYSVLCPFSDKNFSVISWAPILQQIALACSLAQGLNPDQPRDLVKAVVTE